MSNQTSHCDAIPSKRMHRLYLNRYLNRERESKFLLAFKIEIDTGELESYSDKLDGWTGANDIPFENRFIVFASD